MRGKNSVVFTAGGNAAGKSAAVDVARAGEGAHVVLDSTFSNAEHARHLVHSALGAGKAVFILYLNRPLGDAFKAMIERAGSEGRVVTIDQLIKSQRGAAETARGLWKDFAQDPRFTFTFLNNSAEERTSEAEVEAAIPQEYNQNWRDLNEFLDAEYRAERIPETTYRRIRGR